MREQDKSFILLFLSNHYNKEASEAGIEQVKGRVVRASTTINDSKEVRFGRNEMPVMKFKNFDDVDRFEREGKGMSWNFKPDQAYFAKALRFRIKIPFPPGLYKFKTFRDAEIWEREWYIKSGITKRDR